MKMPKQVKWISLAVISALLAGCVTIPRQIPKINHKKEIDEVIARDNWNHIKPLTIVEIPGPSIIKVPGQVPERFEKQKITIDTGEGHSLGDFMAILGHEGIPSIIASDMVSEYGSSVRLSDAIVPLTHFSGSVSDLLLAISRTLDVSFSWKNNILIVGKSGEYVYAIVQNQEMGDKVLTDLENLGAEDVKYSVATGLISFNADWKEHEDVTEYMERITEGMGTINLQVSIITVQLNKESKTGFDWSRMNMTTRGGVTQEQAIALPQNPGNPSPTDPVNNTPNYVPASDVLTSVSGLVTTINSSAAGFILNKGSFSMRGLFSTLREYGEARTNQSVILKTLPGTEVSVRSGNAIPYVSGITNSAFDGGATSGVTIETADTGITIDVTPNLDAKSGIITMEVDMEVKSFLGWFEIDAGNDVGTLTQPNIQEQTFKDIARMTLGDTVVLGGASFSSSTDNRNTMPGLENLPVGHEDLELKRNALFIVIRPTAVIYEFDPEKNLKNARDYINSRVLWNSIDVTPEDEPVSAGAVSEADKDYQVEELIFKGDE